MKTHPRRLNAAHFAFMRAIAQGLDERASWDRYLSMEGSGSDTRNIRRFISRIRDEFAAAARRERKPGIARLVLIDPSRMATTPEVPDLARFAQERGMEDFSESELLEAFQEAFPQAPGGGIRGRRTPAARRAHVVARQLQALHWLQGIVARDPRPGDPLSDWIDPALARRLRGVGIETLAELGARINGAGSDWWAPIRGIGQRKAARLLNWLEAQEPVLGLGIDNALALARAVTKRPYPVSTAAERVDIVPCDQLLMPPSLDGSNGTNRAPATSCNILAADDREAIAAWLATKQAPYLRISSATHRSYRREGERLILWAVLLRRKALSSLDAEDARAFQNFLRNPPSGWCAPRYVLRTSSEWRPLEGPLSPTAARQSQVILRGLFGFLVEAGYLLCNPFAAPASPPYVRSARATTGPGRARDRSGDSPDATGHAAQDRAPT